MSEAVKNVWIAAALLLAIAMAAGFAGYRAGCDPAMHEQACRSDTMAWLRQEFHLTDAQYAAIDELHRGYTASCDEHCRAIREAMQARDALESAKPADPAAIAAAGRRVRELSGRCETALLRHLGQVAALMSPEDGRRYLGMMRPLVAKFRHTGAPDLDLSASHAGHGH